MRSTAFTWTAALSIIPLLNGAGLTVAAAPAARGRQVEDGPQLYYPKHIKRQVSFGNSTSSTTSSSQEPTTSDDDSVVLMPPMTTVTTTPTTSQDQIDTTTSSALPVELPWRTGESFPINSNPTRSSESTTSRFFRQPQTTTESEDDDREGRLSPGTGTGRVVDADPITSFPPADDTSETPQAPAQPTGADGSRLGFPLSNFLGPLFGTDFIPSTSPAPTTPVPEPTFSPTPGDLDSGGISTGSTPGPVVQPTQGEPDPVEPPPATTSAPSSTLFPGITVGLSEIISPAPSTTRDNVPEPPATLTGDPPLPTNPSNDANEGNRDGPPSPPSGIFPPSTTEASTAPANDGILPSLIGGLGSILPTGTGVGNGSPTTPATEPTAAEPTPSTDEPSTPSGGIPTLLPTSVLPSDISSILSSLSSALSTGPSVPSDNPATPTSTSVSVPTADPTRVDSQATPSSTLSSPANSVTTTGPSETGPSSSLSTTADVTSTSGISPNGTFTGLPTTSRPGTELTSITDSIPITTGLTTTLLPSGSTTTAETGTTTTASTSTTTEPPTTSVPISFDPIPTDFTTTSPPISDNFTISTTSPIIHTSDATSLPNITTTAETSNAASTTPPIATTPAETSATTTSTESTTAASGPTETSTEEVPTTTAPTTTSSVPISIIPTGTISGTTIEDAPTSIIYAPTNSAPTTSVPSGIPTTLPRLIQPREGIPARPDNASLIQVGFTFALNYPFVVNSSSTTQQIFRYVPAGLSYGLSVSPEEIHMYGLRPYDTTTDLKYITTLAMAYIPADKVNQLALDIHNSIAPIYNNPDMSTNTVMSFIDPTISIQPGDSTENKNGGKPGGYDSTDTATGAQGGGAPIGGDSGASAPVKGSSVGIGMGAVAGAAIYAAAMVMVARRYRNKRREQRHQRHQRTPSVPSIERQAYMSQRSSRNGVGYWMSGARGAYGSGTRGSRSSAGGSSGGSRSVRDQGISAPVMAENSLGWN